jgi:hypothetical protein
MEPTLASDGDTAYKYKIYTESLAAGLLLRAGEHKLAQPFIRSLNNFLNAGSDVFSRMDLVDGILPLMHGAIKAERLDLVQACTRSLTSCLRQLRETKDKDEIPADAFLSRIVALLAKNQYFDMAVELLEAFEDEGKASALARSAHEALESDLPQVVSWALNHSASHLDALERQLDRFDNTHDIEERFDYLASAVAQLQLKQGLMVDAEETIKKMRSTPWVIGETLGKYAAFSLKFWAEKKGEIVALAAVEQVIVSMNEDFLPQCTSSQGENELISNFIRAYLEGCSKTSHFIPILPLISEIDEGLTSGRAIASLACVALNIGDRAECTKRWQQVVDFVRDSPQSSKESYFYNQSVLVYEIAEIIGKTVKEQSQKKKAYQELADLTSALYFQGSDYNLLAIAAKKMVQNNCVNEAKRLSSLFEEGEHAKLRLLSFLATAAATDGDITAALKHFDDAAIQVANVLCRQQIEMDQRATEPEADIEDTLNWDASDDELFVQKYLNSMLKQIAAGYDVTFEYCREFGTLGADAARVGLHEKSLEFFSAAITAASMVNVTSRPAAYYVTAIAAVSGAVERPEWPI